VACEHRNQRHFKGIVSHGCPRHVSHEYPQERKLRCPNSLFSCAGFHTSVHYDGETGLINRMSVLSIVDVCCHTNSQRWRHFWKLDVKTLTLFKDESTTHYHKVMTRIDLHCCTPCEFFEMELKDLAIFQIFTVIVHIFVNITKCKLLTVCHVLHVFVGFRFLFSLFWYII